MNPMPSPPDSTKTSLQQRLSAHAADHWPTLATLDVPFKGAFAYIDGHLPDGDTLPLMRLRYGGSANRWGFALYLASKDGYQDQILPTGFTAGTPEKPSTASPPSTSTTPNPRRTYAADHLARPLIPSKHGSPRIPLEPRGNRCPKDRYAK